MNTKLKYFDEKDWLSLARQASWSVSDIAERCGVSVRVLRRHFIRQFGATAKSWITKQRHKQAVELLRDGSLVKETASLLGYKHANNFSREFKKRNGQSPTSLPTVPGGPVPRRSGR